MRNPDDGNHHWFIVDAIDHAIHADPDAPKILLARQFEASWRTRFVGKGISSFADAAALGHWKSQKLFFRGRKKLDSIFHTSPARFLTCSQGMRFSLGSFKRRRDRAI